MDGILSPKSIAIIGASDKQGSVGNAVISNIISGGYRGKIFPVNPKSQKVCDIDCYPSVLDIKEDIDLVVIITPSKYVSGILDECGKKEVKGAIIISAGFREMSQEGAKLEEEAKKKAQEHGIQVVGPNCVGVINTDTDVSLNASFVKDMPKKGNIALISQSGAICAAMLEYAKSNNIGLSKVFSLGNKMDITENDILSELSKDDLTDVIIMYIEELSSGREFIDIASRVTGEEYERKPIIALKVGSSSTGAKAIASHTGSLAGSEEAYNAIFSQAGVIRVATSEELFDHAAAFSSQPIPKDESTVILTNAGGPGIIAADAAPSYGISLNRLSDETVKNLKEVTPPTASLLNPVDIIGDADHIRFEKSLRIVLKDPAVSSCIVMFIPQRMLDVEELARSIVKVNGEFPEKTLLACIMGVSGLDESVNILESNGIPQYTFPESAIRSLSAMMTHKKWVARPRTAVKSFNVDKDRAKKILESVSKDGRSYVHEREAMDVLGAYGFPIPKSGLAKSSDECASISHSIGFPVALKISSPDIVHKFDVGGVVLNVHDEEEAKSAYDKMISDVRSHKPDANILGVNVQEQLSGGKEVIIGSKKDPQFGNLIVFGLGGIYVNVFKDVSFRLSPIKELSAHRMIESTKVNELLKGARGEGASDIDSIVECLERLSQLVTDFPQIEELDINPLLVFERGKGCKAADARIVIS